MARGLRRSPAAGYAAVRNTLNNKSQQFMKSISMLICSGESGYLAILPEFFSETESCGRRLRASHLGIRGLDRHRSQYLFFLFSVETIRSLIYFLIMATADGAVRVVTRVRTSVSDGCMNVNQYCFLAHLGAGAYGEVVLARDLNAGRYVVRARTYSVRTPSDS